MHGHSTARAPEPPGKHTEDAPGFSPEGPMLAPLLITLLHNCAVCKQLCTHHQTRAMPISWQRHHSHSRAEPPREQTVTGLKTEAVAARGATCKVSERGREGEGRDEGQRGGQGHAGNHPSPGGPVSTNPRPRAPGQKTEPGLSAGDRSPHFPLTKPLIVTDSASKGGECGGAEGRGLSANLAPGISGDRGTR